MATQSLWLLLRRAKAEVAELPEEFPRTRVALTQLEKALQEENPEIRSGKKRRRSAAETKNVKHWGVELAQDDQEVPGFECQA